MTDWLKIYIGTLITDLSAHKQALEEKDAEIARLKATIDGMTAEAEKALVELKELLPEDDGGQRDQ